MGKLLLVGCGKMGGAMLEGWLARGLAPSDVVVAEPVEALRPAKPGLLGVAQSSEVKETPQTVVLAVKPQSMDEAVADLRRFAESGGLADSGGFADQGALFLSIAAGKTLGYFAKHLGAGAKVVRAMPNTPAAVRQGITVATASPSVSAEEKKRCHGLLEAVGQVLWVEDEALMDPVTALSGSGPAYVFLLVEAMAAAGARLGLAPDMAMQLARATVAGSGELLKLSSEPAAQLRVNVTSPGGTTAEALKILMAADGIQPVFDKALAAASRRSKELAG
jgi:pyrroline-5-carboxylate reductase